MNRRQLALLFMLAPLVWVEAKPKPTPTPEPEKLEGFKAFHYVKVRNIFDPNRRRDPAEPGSADSLSASSRASDSSRGSPYLVLTGVMTRPEKQVGFFNGSSSDYQKVLGAGQTIGAYTVKSVTMAGVEMERDGKSFTLPVGSQIRFDAAGAGTIQSFAPEPEPTPVLPTVSSSDSSASSSSTTPSAPGSSASPSDVLKRMMERRQQEMSK